MIKKISHMKSVVVLITLCFVAASIACTHPLTIKNLNSYQTMQLQSLTKKVSIGIIPTTSDMGCKSLCKGIGSELSKYASEVLLPYSPASSRKVDVVATINIKPQYEGSGWNFLVNFPGFLIWAPAWNGYFYKVNYDIDVLLTDGSNNQKIDGFSVPVHLDVRHADMNRTWTEISWFEVGVIALVGGIVFTQYDESLTPLVSEKIQTPIGDYIAQEIVARVNNYAGFHASLQ